ncbi:MAG: AI-2E family transporter [Ignavibacteriae bacterium]|nr:MAG: AI-2E family transporter [Ignavibacteriota bacterium]
MSSERTRILTAAANRPMVKVIFLLGIIVSGFWVISFFPDLVLLLIISLLSAFILRPLVSLCEYRFGLRRILSVSIVFMLIGGSLVLLGILFIPMAIERLNALYDGFKNFPFDQKLNEAAISLTANIPFTNPESVAQKVHELVNSGLQWLSGFLTGAAGFLVNLAIVPFITFFILAEGDTALKKLIERVPNKYFEMVLNVLDKIRKELVGYLRGWILDSVIVGIMNIAGYYIIGVNYAILLGIIAGISNLIPYVGPFFGVVPALLISLSQYGDFRQAFLILTVPLLLVQVLDNIIIQPLCFSKTVDMHPITVIVVLIIGNSMMGIAGMLLAIPIATILKSSAVESYWGLKNYRITA